MNKKVCILLLLVVLAEFTVSRRHTRSKNKHSKTARISRPKTETLEDLFNIYDPSFLAVVWPRIINGVHLFVEPACWGDLNVFFKNLLAGRAWACSAIDASGRYKSGLLAGNRYWLGSKEECLQLDRRATSHFRNESLEELRKGGEYLQAMLRKENFFIGDADKWRTLIKKDELMRHLVSAANSPPQRLAYVAVNLSLNITKVTMAEAYSIVLGVCLPRSCSTEDVASVINFSIMINDNLKTNRTIPRVVKVTSLRRVEGHYDIKNDTGALMLICFTVVLVMIAVIATAVDLKLIKYKPHNNKSMSFDLQKCHNNNLDLENKIQNDGSQNQCDGFARKESNVVDMETLTINNMNNTNNINLVTVKKVMVPNALPPSITLDVVSMEKVTGSCKRCGKYKKQCSANNPKQLENLPACPRVKSFASLTAEIRRKDNVFKSLLLCFSLIYSWKRIFNTNIANKDLSIIHILRIIATFWVIFVHIAMIAHYVSENVEDVNAHNNIYYIVMTGTLAFDTLFFVSGLFSAHHFFFLKSQYTVEELVSFGGGCGQILQFVCFVTNRAIRLLPSYAFVIVLTGILARVTHTTSAVALPEAEYTNCDNYWWRNLLYISNFFPRDDQCIQISWYLSLETQLHLFGALACALMATSRRMVFSILVAVMLLSTAADVSGAYVEYGQYFSSVYWAYFTLIERPLARVAPYFIGMLVGWLLIKMESKLYITKAKQTFLWVSSVLGVMMSLATPRILQEWITSLSHPVWALALFWPALVSATTFAGATRSLLENPVIAAMSRLSYSMLLLHGLFALSLMLSADTALCSSTVCIWWYYAGTTILTILGAFLLALLVEIPCCSLLRRLSDYAS